MPRAYKKRLDFRLICAILPPYHSECVAIQERIRHPLYKLVGKILDYCCFASTLRGLKERKIR